MTALPDSAKRVLAPLHQQSTRSLKEVIRESTDMK